MSSASMNSSSSMESEALLEKDFLFKKEKQFEKQLNEDEKKEKESQESQQSQQNGKQEENYDLSSTVEEENVNPHPEEELSDSESSSFSVSLDDDEIDMDPLELYNKQQTKNKGKKQNEPQAHSKIIFSGNTNPSKTYVNPETKSPTNPFFMSSIANNLIKVTKSKSLVVPSILLDEEEIKEPVYNNIPKKTVTFGESVPTEDIDIGESPQFPRNNSETEYTKELKLVAVNTQVASNSKKSRKLPSFMSDDYNEEREMEEDASKKISRKESLELDALDNGKLTTKINNFEEILNISHEGRVICFDTETTGFDSDASIIEIAAVELVDGKRTGFTFSSLIKPEEPYEISPFAFECHQISKLKLEHRPDTKTILTNFMKFVSGAVLVAHNANFDIRMLNQEIIKHKIEVTSPQRFFCTMKYFKTVIPGIGASLDTASKYLDVRKFFKRTTHGAVVDTEILSELFIKLMKLSE